MTEEVRSEKLGEVADEFDAIHTIQRALAVGSVDRIIPAAELRPYVVDALERGMARHALGRVTAGRPRRPRAGQSGRSVRGRWSQECAGCARLSPGEPAASTGGGRLRRASTVSRQTPSRRHQPDSSPPSLSRACSGDQAPSAAAGSVSPSDDLDAPGVAAQAGLQDLQRALLGRPGEVRGEIARLTVERRDVAAARRG